MKKYLLSIFAILFCFLAMAQTFNPTTGTVSNKPYSPSQSVPTDARSYFYDATNFLWRPYQNSTEVLTFLNLPKYRGGNVIYVVDSGGVLNPNGTYTNFHATFYMFADGVADANLVKLNLYGGSSGGCVGCLLAANNLSDVANIATSRTNLGLGSMAVLNSTAGGDLSGTWPAITVAKFNGLSPSYYLNYNNLSNLPTIPSQLNPTCVGCSITGTYPNLTWTVTGAGFNTAGVYLVASGGGSIVNYDTANHPVITNITMLNDSVQLVTYNNRPPDTLSIRGGTGSGGGGGSGTVINVSVVSANGISGTVANPTSTPAITLVLGNITPTTVDGLTLAALSTGFAISGGTTSKTLTVPLDATVSGTNTGNVSLSGETYLTISGQAITVGAVNVSGTNITGILKAASFPALTGPITTSAGSLATSVTNNAITNAMLAQMGAGTIKGNNTGSTGNALDLTATQVTAMLNTFTTTLKGLVPAPSTSTGKVLSDAGTWVTNGTGSTNLNVGAFYRLAIPGTNNIKTVAVGYGILADSTTNANSITFFADTSILALKGSDTITVYSPGTGGFPVGIPNGDTLILYRLFAGANITIDSTTNPGGLTITSTGGGGGGISLIGTFDSQTPSANGSVISGSSIYFQSASATNPGMVNNTTQTLSGQKTFSSAPKFSTLTTNGGIFYGNATGTLLQTGAGTTTTVLHGGTSPSYSAVVLTTDISGILPIVNGGNGSSTPGITGSGGVSVTGTWPNQNVAVTGFVSSVNASGGSTGFSFSGGPITSSGTLTMSGTLVVANGGTGAVSLSPYAIIAGGSTPTGAIQQVSGLGASGQVLVSNGSGALPSWQNNTAGLLHGTVGDFIYYGSDGSGFATGLKYDSTNSQFTSVNYAYNITETSNSFQTLISANTMNWYRGPDHLGHSILFASPGKGFRIGRDSAEIQFANDTLVLRGVSNGVTYNGITLNKDGSIYFRSASAGTVVGYYGYDATGKLVVGSGGGSNFTDTTIYGTVTGGSSTYSSGLIGNVIVNVAVNGVIVPGVAHTGFNSYSYNSGTGVFTFNGITFSTGDNLQITYRIPTTGGGGVSGITALTGDGTASGPGSVALTLATVNSNVGTFGDATHVAQFTVNGKGLITGVTSVAISGGGGSTLTRQNITSGSSGTVTGGNYLVKFDFSSVAASYTLTTPASPSDQDIVEIQSGTTISAPNAEISSFTIVANSGQTLNFLIPVSGIQFNSGGRIRIQYNAAGTYWDRIY